MRIAYIVSAYKRPVNLVRLVRRLHTGADTTFLIHVDLKTDERVVGEMVDGLEGLGGVEFLPRHVCRWGDFGHVQASLKGIRALVATTPCPDYVILLSGQDYPIKPNAYIQDFLAAAEGRSFFLHFPLPTENWSRGGLDRLRNWHYRGRKLHLSLPLRRSLPPHLRPWGGSAYWIVSQAALRTIHEFVEANPWYVRFFRHVHIPDELFFQTILLNSEEADRCVNFRLHYTEWSRQPAPAVLTGADFPELVDSACLFARKFDSTVDSEVLDMIDACLLC